MIRSKTWPKNTKKNGTIRIFGQNVNGVSYLDNYSEWKIILETLHTQQCDVTCLTEINIDVKNPEVKYALVHQAKMLDKNSHIIMTGSSTKTQNSKSKRDVMVTMTRGNWSGRIIDSGADKLGRWTYITMTGKNNQKLTIYTLYRVCDQKHNCSDCTIYLQQQNDLVKANRVKTEPREAILMDLTDKIQQNQKQGHDIIVIGDANEDVYQGKRINEFLQENNLYNVIKKINDKEGPAAYD